jgi:hypothetical protein
MLLVRPLTLKQLNKMVEELHRHHKPIQGHRFSLGCVNEEGKIVGACSVGRPTSRGCRPFEVAEVTRLVTDGTKNACSILYAAAARACDAMGYRYIQTYILKSEPGTALKAAGWELDGLTRGGDWIEHGYIPRTLNQPFQRKQRWIKKLGEVRWQKQRRHHSLIQADQQALEHQTLQPSS